MPVETTLPPVRRSRTSRRSAGFTLIELVIVVLVLGILASLAAPNLRQAQIRAAASAGAQALSQVETSIELAIVAQGWGGFGGKALNAGSYYIPDPPAKVQAELEALKLSRYLTPADLDLGWGVIEPRYTPPSSGAQGGGGSFIITITPSMIGEDFNPLGEAAIRAMRPILGARYHYIGGDVPSGMITIAQSASNWNPTNTNAGPTSAADSAALHGTRKP